MQRGAVMKQPVAAIGGLADLVYPEEAAPGFEAMKAWLPSAFEFGNQSPQLKMPSTLPAPTFEGNSTGELAPLDR